MRRSSILITLTCLAFGLLAVPALATFHENVVNEVMLASASGDPGVQFVELLDNGGTEEAFTPVFAPYKLVVYDGAGNKVGEQTLDPNGLRSAATADREYLVSTAGADAAFGVMGDERLTVSLPAGGGEACFEANTNPSAVSCMTWGTDTKPAATNSNGSGTVNGPVPPNGESDQRRPDRSVIVAAPTPKARNATAGTGTGTGPGGGGSGAPIVLAFGGVHFAAKAAEVDRTGHASVALTCPAGSGGCSGTLTLTVKSKRAGAKARTVKLGRARFTLAAGSSGKVTVKLTRAARTLLARKHGLKARARVVAKDARGRTKVSLATVTLRAR